MKPKTEKILGTLEVITNTLEDFGDISNIGYKTFLWEASQKRNFDILQLMLFEKFIQVVNPEKVIQNWLKEEQTHSIAPREKYSLDQPDPEKFLDNLTKIYREDKYKHLLQTLNEKLEDLEGFAIRLSSSEYEKHNCIYSLIGRTTQNNWVAISSTAPQRHKIPNWILCTPFQENNSQQPEDSIQVVSNIREILNELKPLKLAVCYPDGYGYTYDYQHSYAFSATRSAAFTQSLINSKILSLNNFQGFLSGYRQQVLAKFLKTSFYNVLVYYLASYDTDYIYILGQVAGDWLGVRISRGYEYI